MHPPIFSLKHPGVGSKTGHGRSVVRPRTPRVVADGPDGPAGGTADGRTDQNVGVNRRTDGPVRGPSAGRGGAGGQHAHKAQSPLAQPLPITSNEAKANRGRRRQFKISAPARHGGKQDDATC